MAAGSVVMFTAATVYVLRARRELDAAREPGRPAPWADFRLTPRSRRVGGALVWIGAASLGLWIALAVAVAIVEALR
jgi:hypothetical protein